MMQLPEEITHVMEIAGCTVERAASALSTSKGSVPGAIEIILSADNGPPVVAEPREADHLRSIMSVKAHLREEFQAGRPLSLEQHNTRVLEVRKSCQGIS